MKLAKVKEGFHLHYPKSFPEFQRYRGGPGYVVDLEAPMESEFCAGQEYKLGPAGEGDKPSPIESPTALRLIAEKSRAGSPAAAPNSPLPSVSVPKKRAATKPVA